MGFIRGGLLVIVVVLLFLSLLCVNLFWTLTLSLNYDNVEKESTIIVKDFLLGGNMTSQLKIISPLLKLYCQNNSDYVLREGGYTLDIPCSAVLQGEDAIIDGIVKNLVHEIYYTKYDCNFIDCVKKSQIPMFLISEKAHNYWKSKLYLLLIVSFILVILIFFLVERKTNMLLILGSLMIISSLPFLKLEALFSLFSNKLLLQFLQSLFSKAHIISLWVLITGVILLVLGIIFKIFKVGFFVSDFISKFKEKSEVVKGKQKPKQSNQKNIKKTSKTKSK